MNMINLLLMAGFLTLLAPNKVPFPPPGYENGPLGPIIDLARLAKGRFLVCFIKEGMKTKPVIEILGPPSMFFGGIGRDDCLWPEYGISVDFASLPPFGVAVENYDPEVTRVRWEFPQYFRWNRLWSFGSGHQEKQKWYAPTSFLDAVERVHELINDYADLQEDVDCPGEDGTEPIPAEEPDAESRLETLLHEWEKADHQIRELHCTFTLTTEDRVFKDKETYRGEVFFKKPDLVRIDWKDKEGKLFEIWLFKDNTVRTYDLVNQTEGICMANLDGFENCLTRMPSFVFTFARLACSGPPLAEALKNYHFHLKNEDKRWACIQLEPRDRDALRYVQELEVILNQKTHLVRQIRYSTSTDRMTLDFENVGINPTPPITSESISKDLPKELKRLRESPKVDENAVIIAVRVPENAEVWFDGEKTSQKGTLREFVTPPLEPNQKFSYEISARWTENGKEVTRTRKEEVVAGDRLLVYWLAPEKKTSPQPIAPPKPAP